MNNKIEEITLELNSNQLTVNHAQLAGIGSLIFLAIREETTLEYQWEEWGFDDISHETILILDRELDAGGFLWLVNACATSIFFLIDKEKAII